MTLNKNLAISDSGFLFNPTNGDSFSMNAVATDMISLLKEGKSHEQIKQVILDKYEVEKSALERDFDEFMMELRDNYLMKNDEQE
ncbi:MAG: PqqD family protein [Chitinophagales bacterium]